MLKYFLYISVGIIVSFGFFPFSFYFLPALNTKNILAGLGLVLLAYNLGVKKSAAIDKDFFILFLFSGVVSLFGFISTGYNNTSDYTYSTYTMSMLIWLSSSYVIVSAIRFAHHKASVELIVNYLTGVCVAQCVLAMLMAYSPALRALIDAIQPPVEHSIGQDERLSGLGCAVDVAGTRFAAVLVLVAGLCANRIRQFSQSRLCIYLTAFLIISVIGNMIARTTTLGIALAIAFWIFSYWYADSKAQKAYMNMARQTAILLGIAIPVFIYLYSTNIIFHKYIEFAFEGFFSLVQKGTWEVTSNDRLATMVIFPDNLKTWIIGDGYFNNPLTSDYHYIGPGANTEFYMYTDIGYLRFIFYFGVLGTLAFIIYLYKAASICMNRFSSYKMMFFFILLANYIIWCKVATDIFLVFALFLVVSKEEYEQERQECAAIETMKLNNQE